MKKSELIREQFSKRLKQALAQNGKDGWGSGTFLKNITGVTQKAANNWLNGESIPNKEKITLISKALGISSAWLEYGEDETSHFSTSLSGFKNIKSEMIEVFYYPVIEWNDIENFLDGHLSQSKLKKTVSTKKIEQGFWLEVKDDLMSNPSLPSFPKGSLILVDKNYNQLENGKFLLIQLLNGDKIFRQIVKNSNNTYLKTLNEKYLPVLIKDDDGKVLGKITDLYIQILD
ncbi:MULTISPECIES: helix-turn-helix domain-containing protein [Entomomonas]|uniref:Helix-turn-helix domain-containing protein n=1 Tax=Entomomonas asaccharolytica TaxID=2785331 RepID=A0A974RWC7_9GAMM|nr:MULTISPECIES: S24 family peptidase [Entomomonas]QQP85040.1 helix-turn-helix domain-containing protein [Entomomonas asaccharolytica]UYZ85301.1 helix-turn-helix domain-containing protein [Entomomonas sp. E2T0]